MTKTIQALATIILGVSLAVVNAAELKEEFNSPPDSARPGVYWYFMDGNMDREMMEVDLESMHDAGIRKALFLEVNIGVVGLRRALGQARAVDAAPVCQFDTDLLQANH